MKCKEKGGFESQGCFTARGEKKEIKRLLWRCVRFFSRQFTARGISFIELVLYTSSSLIGFEKGKLSHR